jgi:hypothetical protein
MAMRPSFEQDTFRMQVYSVTFILSVLFGCYRGRQIRNYEMVRKPMGNKGCVDVFDENRELVSSSE